VAEDLVQDTFLSALKALDTFRGNASEKTWLTGILKNKIIDYYKKASTRYEKKESDNSRAGTNYDYFFSEEQNGHWTDEQGPSEWDNQSLESKEFYGIFNRCLGKLPEKWALAFSRKTLDEVPTEEVCKELGISSSNFWVIIHRAKLQLRACIEKNWIKS
jgi:RNA polymerase sigma-70 factor (TIGR02943 family)